MQRAQFSKKNDYIWKVEKKWHFYGQKSATSLISMLAGKYNINIIFKNPLFNICDIYYDSI